MTTAAISKAPFGTTPDGKQVDIYTLRNSNGLEARIMTYGGIVVSLKTPDKSGRFDDVVLGYDSLDGYLKRNPYFGALIGRCGNRIAKGKFSLNGNTYLLATNQASRNHLHGGIKGFDKVVWTAKTSETSNGPALELSYLSKDGEEGYPGNLSVTATYTLTADNGLKLDFTATTDKHTICNLTHHSYFNFHGGGDVLDYVVQINAEQFTAVNADVVPTGEVRSVSGTPLDFRKPTQVGARINNQDEQLQLAGGYDHNWVFSKPAGQLASVARVADKVSGRCMEVFTTQPGMQFYSGNFLDGTIIGKSGQKYNRRYAFCMEPQHFPDAPNHPHFPSIELQPGQVYKNTIIYKFSTE
ncbi:MAG TPA: aldose epimerase family protein [Verrucomicrobiae bacterium]|jgi:aldose 1-epimerase|nr:aldose epimerase family protein [Verrucomicrobiae bacterium]